MVLSHIADTIAMSVSLPGRITVNDPMEYKVNEQLLSYNPVGPDYWGGDEVLVNSAVDLTQQTPWHEAGYGVEKLFKADVTFQVFLGETSRLIRHLWQSAGLSIDDDVDLTQYHLLVRDSAQHLAAVGKTKLIETSLFPLGIKNIEERVSDICKIPLHGKNPYDGLEVFHFRVIRPTHGDNNPLHRDVWLEDYDDCINLYIPIAGSTERSSLVLLRGSHLWPERRVKRTREGAVIGGLTYNVPAVTAIEGPYAPVRPNPGFNEVLVFSPYLIHGGAVNLNNDQTRISIEIRLWKK